MIEAVSSLVAMQVLQMQKPLALMSRMVRHSEAQPEA